MAGGSTFHLRVRVDGKFFRLGEKKFYLKGVSYGPFAPDGRGEMYASREQTIRDFRQIQELGANLIRLYELPPRWLLDLADCMVTGAIERTESRGAHARTDYPERDDEHWMRHTLAYMEDDEVRLDYSEVTVTQYEPEVRSY